MESRTQGSRPRPRTQKNFEAKDRPSRGQGHKRKCSPKKKGLQNFFSGVLKKKGFQKFFSSEKGLQKFVDVIFQDYVDVIDSKLVLVKILVNTSPHAKFGVSLNYGLGVRMVKYPMSNKTLMDKLFLQ